MYASDIYFVFNHQLFTYFSLDLPTVGGYPGCRGCPWFGWWVWALIHPTPPPSLSRVSYLPASVLPDSLSLHRGPTFLRLHYFPYLVNLCPTYQNGNQAASSLYTFKSRSRDPYWKWQAGILWVCWVLCFMGFCARRRKGSFITTSRKVIHFLYIKIHYQLTLCN